MPQAFNWTKAIEGAFIGGLLSAFTGIQPYLNGQQITTSWHTVAVAILVSFLIGAVRGLSQVQGVPLQMQQQLNTLADDIGLIHSKLKTKDVTNASGPTVIQNTQQSP